MLVVSAAASMWGWWQFDPLRACCFCFFGGSLCTSQRESEIDAALPSADAAVLCPHAGTHSGALRRTWTPRRLQSWSRTRTWPSRSFGPRSLTNTLMGKCLGASSCTSTQLAVSRITSSAWCLPVSGGSEFHASHTRTHTNTHCLPLNCMPWLAWPTSCCHRTRGRLVYFFFFLLLLVGALL